MTLLSSGQALSAEQASWPQTNICQLRLSRTNITPATLGFLTSLQELQLLDIRCRTLLHAFQIPSMNTIFVQKHKWKSRLLIFHARLINTTMYRLAQCLCMMSMNYAATNACAQLLLIMQQPMLLHNCHEGCSNHCFCLSAGRQVLGTLPCCLYRSSLACLFLWAAC